VRVLTTVTFLQWLGASAILPLLPKFLERQEASDALVGVVMAAFFAAGVLTQFPAGVLADRVGRRPVLLAGLLLYAAASAAFLVPSSAGAFVALRALQGVGSGAAEVAALAILSSTVAFERRGRAFGAVYGGMLAGMALGPILGSLVGVDAMGVVFVLAGVTSLLACIPVLRGTPGGPGTRRAHRPALRRPPMNRALLGSLMTAAALGLTAGVYEACWTLLLQDRGAANWQIGLSWTLFSVPFVLMARPGGWLADQFDRRILVFVSVLCSAGLCALYPFVHSIGWLLGLGALEAVGVAIALPSAQSLLTQQTPPTLAGEVQGMFSTSETSSIALAAALGGVLFSVAPWAPFVAAGAGAAGLAVAIRVVWAPVTGRAAMVA
jgi:DHA1 family multidrug resistance protein-like MFS transporter